MTARGALLVTAGLNVGLHAAGLGLSAWGIRPGSPLVTPAERTAYLARSPLGWSLAWATWMLCALALVAFLAVIARHLPDASGLTSFAVTLAAAGAAVDLLCDALFITVLPALAADGPTPLFMAFERALGAGGTIAANGLYSVAVLLVTARLPRGIGVLRLAHALGLATFVAGMSLVAAGFSGDPRHLEPAAGATILAFIAWALAATMVLARRGEGR